VTPLPIDAFVPAIKDALASARAVVVTAPPGTGKTTRVPPALVDRGRVLVLEPRRVAARAVARRIAAERGWTLGRDVGWHVRHERRFAPGTSLIIATEGMLTARCQEDPLLSDLHTVVIDEFHERSAYADLGLALARQAWRARADLGLVVMSATLDAARVAAFLDHAPVVNVPGRIWPLDIVHRPGVSIEDAVAAEFSGGSRAVLCFLPGAGEIRRAADRLSLVRALSGVEVLPLHGGLDADEQDRALDPRHGLRVILATNIAETSLTVPDVTTVIDTGLHKVARYDAERGIDSLDVERITADSADQRAGRAGRTGPGRVVRLWDARDRLRPYREPELSRVDLASTVVSIAAWGGDARTFDWFEPPPPGAVDRALAFLLRLGAVDSDGHLTAQGRRLAKLPLHPRLSTLVLADGGSVEAARAAALLSERHHVPPRLGATACDLYAAVEGRARLTPHVETTARAIEAAARSVLGAAVPGADETRFRRAVLAAYPDRVARRRDTRRDAFLLAAGTGARLARESGVHNATFIVAVDVAGAAADPMAGGAVEPLIRLATAIEADWIGPTVTEVRHDIDEHTGLVRAWRVERYDAIVLNEVARAVDPVAAAALLAEAAVRRGPQDADAALLARLAFAGLDARFDDLVRAAVENGALRFDELDLYRALPAAARRALDDAAPATLRLPRGRTVRLAYRHAGLVVASTRLQDVFGLRESPRLGPRKVPVTFELLAPNGRPAQVTSDLASFWARGYAEVRNELRRRYPRHAWPESPG
jgi:ATP-dependent helicase HrpB